MRQAIAKYFYDLTRYNLGFSILIGIALRPIAGIITFGTFGMLVGLICYRYFQNNQYYFYYNLGISKLRLVSVTWFMNLTFMVFLLWMIW